MELINNTTKTLKDDLSVEIKQGSKVSIAAACFSIYAFQELKAQLSQIDELRFIFTSPTFVTEKAKKEKRIFFIAETKGTMESLELRPIEQAKISCAKKLFNEMSTSNVVYHDVDSYQSLLNIMNSL